MDDSKISLYLVFLVLSSLRVMADQINTTPDPFTPPSSNQSSPISTTINAPADPCETTTNGNANATCPMCLIDTQMGMIAVASAGGMILCLLVTTLVLACQVCCLQRRIHAPRPSRSNVDLVSGTGYWGTDQPEASGGVVGPCDDSVMMAEVSVDRQKEREEEMEQAEFDEELEDEAEREAMESRPDEEVPLQIRSSTSRDSCLNVPQDLENMPLMV